MGSAQSHVTEVVAATIVVAGAAAVYSYKPSSSQLRSENELGDGLESTSTAGKKNKRKRKAGAESVAPAPAEKAAVEPTVLQFPNVVPGGFDASSAPADTDPTPDPAPKSAKSKKKKTKKTGTSGTTTSRPVDTMSDSSATAPESSAAVPVRPGKQRKAATPKPAPVVAPVDTDGSWTRVEAKQKKNTQQANPLDAGTSDAGITTTSVTGTSSPAALGSDAEDTDDVQASTSDNRRTFAEKMLPKPRKTGVDEYVDCPSCSLSR